MIESQNQEILKHLSKGLTLTPYQALQFFGCLRLSARIRNLKDKVHKIHTTMISVNCKRVACYKLHRK